MTTQLPLSISSQISRICMADFPRTAASYVSAIDEFSLDAPGIGPDTRSLTVGPTFDAQLRPGNAYPLGDLNAVELDIDGGFRHIIPGARRPHRISYCGDSCQRNHSVSKIDDRPAAIRVDGHPGRSATLATDWRR